MEVTAGVKAVGLGVQRCTEVGRSVLGGRAEKDLLNEWTVGRRRGFGLEQRVWVESQRRDTLQGCPFTLGPNISSGEVARVRLSGLGSGFGLMAECRVHGDERTRGSAWHALLTIVHPHLYPQKALERP